MEMTTLSDVIIVAAGSGSRFGAPKQFAELEGKPLYHHSLKTFSEHPQVGRIILVISPNDISRIEQEVAAGFNRQKIYIALGGALRQDSVANGMQKLEELGDSAIVLVHDAARPFVTSGLISEVINAVAEHGAALAAIPVVDTLKQSEEGYSLVTIPRRNLWRAQTPQGARFELMQRALRAAHEQNYSGTDEAELLEKAGIKPYLVQGDIRNVKITYQKDLQD